MRIVITVAVNYPIPWRHVGIAAHIMYPTYNSPTHKQINHPSNQFVVQRAVDNKKFAEQCYFRAGFINK